MLVLVYSFGGIHAPGVFWLAGIPIFSAIFFQKRGMLIGTSLVIIILGLFYGLEKEILAITKPVPLELYLQEKRMNVLHFCIVINVFFFYYITLEKKVKSELEKSNEQLDTLLHVVLHDLSNPITVLKLKFSGLKRKYLLRDNEQEQVNRSFLKIEEIISNVRSFQISSENLDEQRELISQSQIEDYILTSFNQLNSKSLILKFEGSFRSRFKCVPSILRDHILANLISNAVKFSYENSTIKVIFQEASDDIEISIIDEGIGIPISIQESIFEFDKKTTRLGTNGEVGTGYGLPIVHYFTDLSGGVLNILSPVSHDKGTKISLAFKAK